MSWTSGKIEKAQRLLPRILDTVAGALDVSVDEVWALWSEGVRPPVESAKVVLQIETRAGSPRRGAPRYARTKEVTPGAAVASEIKTVAPAQPSPPPRLPAEGDVRLVDRLGRFLTRDAEGFSRRADAAWCGPRERAEVLQRRRPEYRRLKLEAAS